MIEEVVSLVLKAGEEVLKVYSVAFGVEYKEDRTPLTEADRRSHAALQEGLTRLTPSIPVISEEGKNRKAGERFWLVDPLDGTKEFIKRNGQFTVNVALIEKCRPTLGVVYAPALSLLYFAKEGEGAYRWNLSSSEKEPLKTSPPEGEELKVVVSRSHLSPETERLLERLKERFKIESVSVGSSLKFCLLAEGSAHFYPRLGPTMEWDTAAAHAVLKEAGGSVKVAREDLSCGEEFTYGKEDFKNPHFYAFCHPELESKICP